MTPQTWRTLSLVSPNASHLFDASWQLATHIRLPRKQLQQLGRGLRLVTRAGPTLVAVLALLPWSPAQAAVPRQAAASLLTTFESATAAAASAAWRTHIPFTEIPVDEAVDFVDSLSYLLNIGECALPLRLSLASGPCHLRWLLGAGKLPFKLSGQCLTCHHATCASHALHASLVVKLRSHLFRSFLALLGAEPAGSSWRTLCLGVGARTQPLLPCHCQLCVLPRGTLQRSRPARASAGCHDAPPADSGQWDAAFWQAVSIHAASPVE